MSATALGMVQQSELANQSTPRAAVSIAWGCLLSTSTSRISVWRDSKEGQVPK